MDCAPGMAGGRDVGALDCHADGTRDGVARGRLSSNHTAATPQRSRRVLFEQPGQSLETFGKSCWRTLARCLQACPTACTRRWGAQNSPRQTASRWRPLRCSSASSRTSPTSAQRTRSSRPSSFSRPAALPILDRASHIHMLGADVMLTCPDFSPRHIALNDSWASSVGDTRCSRSCSPCRTTSASV